MKLFTGLSLCFLLAASGCSQTPPVKPDDRDDAPQGPVASLLLPYHTEMIERVYNDRSGSGFNLTPDGRGPTEPFWVGTVLPDASHMVDIAIPAGFHWYAMAVSQPEITINLSAHNAQGSTVATDHGSDNWPIIHLRLGGIYRLEIANPSVAVAKVALVVVMREPPPPPPPLQMRASTLRKVHEFLTSWQAQGFNETPSGRPASEAVWTGEIAHSSSHNIDVEVPEGYDWRAVAVADSSADIDIDVKRSGGGTVASDYKMDSWPSVLVEASGALTLSVINNSEPSELARVTVHIVMKRHNRQPGEMRTSVRNTVDEILGAWQQQGYRNLIETSPISQAHWQGLITDSHTLQVTVPEGMAMRILAICNNNADIDMVVSDSQGSPVAEDYGSDSRPIAAIVQSGSYTARIMNAEGRIADVWVYVAVQPGGEVIPGELSSAAVERYHRMLTQLRADGYVIGVDGDPQTDEPTWKGMLPSGGNHEVTFVRPPGKDWAAFAVAQDGNDIDLFAVDSNGNQLVSDMELDSYPSISMPGGEGGPIKIRVSNCESSPVNAWLVIARKP